MNTAPIIAAIYARKSTDDSDKAADNKSVTRQIEHAQAFARARGWVVRDDLVFCDDHVSGAEFVNRPGLQKMLAAATAFQVLVVSELSRLGRDMMATVQVIQTLKDAGVAVHSYLSGQEEKIGSNMDTFVVLVKSMLAAEERESASQRARDALLRRARMGVVTGGKVYGYDNIQVNAPTAAGLSVRAYTDHAINLDEAEIVRGIFQMYLAGHGYVSIAKTLNGDTTKQYPALRVQYFIGKTPSAPRGAVWAASGIRDMLHNARYTGMIIYGQNRNTYKKGRAKLREAQDEANWVQTPRPDLRIVNETLWSAVQKRLAAEAEAYASQSAGLVDKQRHSQHLLSGLMVCSVCGHRMVAIRSSYGGGRTRHSVVSYMCGGYKKTGQARCSNSLRKPAVMFETKILQILKEAFLSPHAIEALMLEVGDLLEHESAPQQQLRDNLRDELKKTEREMENLWALAAEGAPAGLAERIKSREERKRVLDQQLAELENQSPIDFEQIESLKQNIKATLEDLENVLREGGDQTRKVLREFLGDRPIRCEPIMEGRKKGYRLAIPFSFEKVVLEPTIQILAHGDSQNSLYASYLLDLYF